VSAAWAEIGRSAGVTATAAVTAVASAARTGTGVWSRMGPRSGGGVSGRTCTRYPGNPQTGRVPGEQDMNATMRDVNAAMRRGLDGASRLSYCINYLVQ